MSLALYRKYRPATFAEVVGQDHVTGPLQRALETGRVHHAYLFSGPRGCGKTSSARILARSLNCVEGPTPTPCGECESCVALGPTGPGSLDVIEIDAASHNGVDDARDLRERAFFAPVSSQFKIYIIDEAHMVTTAAFNALLKVVEEPPPHVKFIFATTEPEKVITTIKSRTFQYRFRLVPPNLLQRHLAELCEREQVTVDSKVLPVVVRAGGGSVRDSLSVLDQLIAGAGDEGITYDYAVQLLGFTDAALLDEVVDGFAAGDGRAVFGAVDRAVESGLDPRRFAEDLLERVRDLMLLDAVPDAGETGLLKNPADELDAMRGQGARFGAANLARAGDVLAAGLAEMKGATSPRLLLELMCARILLPGAAGDESALAARLDRLERRMAIGGAPAAPPDGPATPAPTAAAAPPATPTTAPTTAPAPPAAPTTAPPAAPADAPAPPPPAPAAPAAPAGQGQIDAAGVRRLWEQILDAVKSRSRTSNALLSQYAQVVEADAGTVTLSFSTGPIRKMFDDGSHIDVLQEALRDVLGGSWRVRTTTAGAPGAAPGATPAGPTSAGPMPAGSGAAAPAATATATAPGPDDFDPDEEVDLTDEAAAGPRRSAEEDAIALLQQGLGAQVVDEP